MIDPQQANTIPMFSPEGKLADVPSEKYQDALKPENGFTPAVAVTSPEGQDAYLPHEKVEEATKNHGFALGPSSQQQRAKMYTSSGKYAEIPQNAVEYAQQQGWKPGIQMTSPSGIELTIHPDDAKKALDMGWGIGPAMQQPKPGFLARTVGGLMGVDSTDIANSRFKNSDTGKDSDPLYNSGSATYGKKLESDEDILKYAGINSKVYSNLNDPQKHLVMMEAKAKLGIPWEDKVAENLPVVGSMIRSGAKAVQSAKKGNISEAAGHGLASALPVFGSQAEGAGEELGQGHVQEGLKQAALTLAPFVAEPVVKGASRLDFSTTSRSPLSKVVMPDNVTAFSTAEDLAKPSIVTAAKELGVKLETSDDALQAIKQAKQNVLVDAHNSAGPGKTVMDLSDTDRQALSQKMAALDAVQKHIEDAATIAKDAPAQPTKKEAAQKILTGAAKMAGGVGLANVIPGGHWGLEIAGVGWGLKDLGGGLHDLVRSPILNESRLNGAIKDTFSSTTPEPRISTPAEGSAKPPFTPAQNTGVEHTGDIVPPRTPHGNARIIPDEEPAESEKVSPYVPYSGNRSVSHETNVAPPTQPGGDLHVTPDDTLYPEKPEIKPPAVEETKPEELAPSITNLPKVIQDQATGRFTKNPQRGSATPEEDSDALSKLPRMAVGTAEGAAKDTALFDQARKNLGPDATMSQIAQEAQRMKLNQVPTKIGEGNIQKIGEGDRIIGDELFNKVDRNKNLALAKEAVDYLKSKGLDYIQKDEGKNRQFVLGYDSSKVAKLISDNKEELETRGIPTTPLEFIKHIDSVYYKHSEDPFMYNLIEKAYGGGVPPSAKVGGYNPSVETEGLPESLKKVEPSPVSENDARKAYLQYDIPRLKKLLADASDEDKPYYQSMIDHLTEKQKNMRGSGRAEEFNRLPFFSRAADVVEKKLAPWFSPEQALNTLKNAGVSSDELDLVKPWLDQQGKKVQKQALLDHIENNGLKVNVSMKGENSLTPEAQKIVDSIKSPQVRIVVEGPLKTDEGLLEFEGMTPEELSDNFSITMKDAKELESVIERMNEVRKITSNSPSDLHKFNALYDKAYDEILEKRTTKRPAMDDAIENSEEFKKEVEDRTHELYREAGGRYGKSGTQYGEYTLPGGKNYREMLIQKPRSGPDGANLFSGGHFEEPNVLAHVRMNDRTIDGKKTLFVEEVQSDWHQQGREKGYLKGKDINSDTGLTSSTSGVPDAPFKKDWHELAMKQVLDTAVREGYDQVGWTTGKQQIDRYEDSMRQNVDEIHYIRDLNKPNSVHIMAKYKDTPVFTGSIPLQGSIKLRGEAVSLDDLVGKEMAQKIRESKESGVLKGDDLAIGGSGMKGFYDEILPQFMNRYTKKWGGRVVDKNLTYSASGLKIIEKHHEDEAPEYLIVNEEGEHRVEDSFASREMAERYLQKEFTPKTDSVHTIEITPKMKEEIKKKGQPISGLTEDHTEVAA